MDTIHWQEYHGNAPGFDKKVILFVCPRCGTELPREATYDQGHGELCEYCNKEVEVRS
jgi:predicted RNA-binding Zn-ribbon protein involved in translation (DUF1610 family)